MTPTETLVASVYAEIMDLHDLQQTDDIFELGGDSMQAVQIALKLEILFEVEIPIESLEGSARILDVAALIDRQLAAGRSLPADGPA